MSKRTRVLIVAERPDAVGALAARLGRFGLETIVAAGDAAAAAAAREHQAHAAIVDVSDRAASGAAVLADALKTGARPRILPVIAIVGENAPLEALAEHVDSMIRAPAHGAQLAARIEMLTRLAVMEDEAKLRADTLNRLGHKVSAHLPNALGGARNILFCGAPNPYFLGLERELREAGANVVATFTSFTAFDYLHERDFDAIVLSAVESEEPAFTVGSALRRNTRLYHTPSLLFVDGAEFAAIDAAFERGFSDILAHDGDPKEAAARVMALASERRRREAVKDVFSRVRAPDLVDEDTGLWSSTFFAEHIGRMADRASVVHRPLSAIVMHASANHEVGAHAKDTALRQVATMLGQLVRTEDLAARLERDVFMVAMPGASLMAAEQAARRLEAVAECTSFDAEEVKASPFQMTISSAAVEQQRWETGRDLLTRAVMVFRDTLQVG